MSAAWRRQQGLTVFEVTLVVILVGILMVIAMERMLRLDVQAERVYLEREIGVIQSALLIEFADRVVHQGPEAARSLAASNPVAVLARPPASYAGEFDEAVPDGLRGGEWYFDTRSRSLVYVVRNAEQFVTSITDPKRARFQVRLVEGQRDGRARIEGVVIEALEPYAWRRD